MKEQTTEKEIMTDEEKIRRHITERTKSVLFRIAVILFAISVAFTAVSMGVGLAQAYLQRILPEFEPLLNFNLFPSLGDVVGRYFHEIVSMCLTDIGIVGEYLSYSESEVNVAIEMADVLIFTVFVNIPAFVTAAGLLLIAFTKKNAKEKLTTTVFGLKTISLAQIVKCVVPAGVCVISSLASLVEFSDKTSASYSIIRRLIEESLTLDSVREVLTSTLRLVGEEFVPIADQIESFWNTELVEILIPMVFIILILLPLVLAIINIIIAVFVYKSTKVGMRIASASDIGRIPVFMTVICFALGLFGDLSAILFGVLIIIMNAKIKRTLSEKAKNKQ